MAYSFERAIVKKGIILLTPEQREVTGFSVWCQIERLPSNRSLNLKYPRARSWYGYVQRLVRGYVVETLPLEYENQLIYLFSNPYQDQLVTQLCLFNALALDLGGSFGTLLNAVADLVQATTLVEVDVPSDITTVLLNRMETDAFLIKLFDDTTAVFRVYGQGPLNPCELEVEWSEPEGPPIPSSETPTTPSPATNIPVNPDDPDGLDLPDAPYDRDSDDDGDSYDPERPTDFPSAEGEGPWKIVYLVQGRSPFPPFQPEGEPQTLEQVLSNGSPRAANPRVTGAFNGPSPYNWVQSVDYAWDLVNPPGPPQTGFITQVGTANEILEYSFERA